MKNFHSKFSKEFYQQPALQILELNKSNHERQEFHNNQSQILLHETKEIFPDNQNHFQSLHDPCIKFQCNSPQQYDTQQQQQQNIDLINDTKVKMFFKKVYSSIQQKQQTKNTSTYNSPKNSANNTFQMQQQQQKKQNLIDLKLDKHISYVSKKNSALQFLNHKYNKQTNSNNNSQTTQMPLNQKKIVLQKLKQQQMKLKIQVQQQGVQTEFGPDNFEQIYMENQKKQQLQQQISSKQNLNKVLLESIDKNKSKNSNTLYKKLNKSFDNQFTNPDFSKIKPKKSQKSQHFQDIDYIKEQFATLQDLQDSPNQSHINNINNPFIKEKNKSNFNNNNNKSILNITSSELNNNNNQQMQQPYYFNFQRKGLNQLQNNHSNNIFKNSNGSLKANKTMYNYYRAKNKSLVSIQNSNNSNINNVSKEFNNQHRSIIIENSSQNSSGNNNNQQFQRLQFLKQNMFGNSIKRDEKNMQKKKIFNQTQIQFDDNKMQQQEYNFQFKQLKHRKSINKLYRSSDILQGIKDCNSNKINLSHNRQSYQKFQQLKKQQYDKNFMSDNQLKYIQIEEGCKNQENISNSKDKNQDNNNIMQQNSIPKYNTKDLENDILLKCRKQLKYNQSVQDSSNNTINNNNMNYKNSFQNSQQQQQQQQLPSYPQSSCSVNQKRSEISPW